MLVPGDYDHCCEHRKQWRKKSIMLGRRALSMSAPGQERRFGRFGPMSASPPTAAMENANVGNRESAN
jgi:hypothetical protein